MRRSDCWPWLLCITVMSWTLAPHALAGDDKKAPAKRATAKKAEKKAAAPPRRVPAKKPAKGVAAKKPKAHYPAYPDAHYDYTPAAMKQQCRNALIDAKAALHALIQKSKTSKQLSFFYTFVPFETILAEFDERIGVFYLLKFTSPKKEIRAAGQVCLRYYFGFLSRLFARRDLYQILKRASLSKETLDAQDQKLRSEILKKFVRNGAALAEAKSKAVAKLNVKLSRLSLQFRGNLAEDKTMVKFTKKELAGLPDTVLNSFKKSKDGHYVMRAIIASQYLAILRNAKDANARKKALLARGNIQADKNTKVLEQVIALRDKFSRMLGYKTYAHYVLDDRMAKTPKKVFAFLTGLRSKLRKKMEQELALLLELKRKEVPGAKRLEAWDWRYYANQLKKTKYALDDEEIRGYFPMRHVIKGVFAIYQTLLNVTFHEIKPAKAWHPDVRLFRIVDNKTKKTISFFYLDLFPRPGKYSHFAAFGFRSGRRLMDGSYRRPVSSIVGNWQKPAAGKDSLLNHYEVQTFFHEFGHIMHQTLTTARYSSMSGSSVKRDFVEAPSQMLENWIWNPSLLKKLSKHHKTGKPLPDALIKRLIAAKHVIGGLYWTRQLFYATIDMTYHTSGAKVDTAKTWRKVVLDVMPVAATQGTRPAAGFGHLMGYAAGYYGYLWSKVFAQDMFTLFEKQGLLSQKAGLHYRKWILEPGGTIDPSAILRGFLGRAPKFDAFYRELGIK